MMIERLREHLEWHLRRLRAARAAAAELSLRPGDDGLRWLTLTHVAVLALEATLAEGIAPDHQALEEVMTDLAAAASAAPREPAAAINPWSAAIVSLSGWPWGAARSR